MQQREHVTDQELSGQKELCLHDFNIKHTEPLVSMASGCLDLTKQLISSDFPDFTYTKSIMLCIYCTLISFFNTSFVFLLIHTNNRIS